VIAVLKFNQQDDSDRTQEEMIALEDDVPLVEVEVILK